ncbi:MAG: B12-binding domain-containing radical SAM protein [Candidatus Helarchaeota archaeon]
MLKSLCPVSSELYRPFFNQFKVQKQTTVNILKDYIKKILEFESKTYGFSVTTGNVICSLYTAKKIKEEKPDSIIIFGGPEASCIYRAGLYLQLPFVDFVIYHNEGEIPIFKFLLNIKDDNNICNSPGLGFSQNNKIYFTDPPNYLELDKLPIPKYELLENFNPEKMTILDILTTKGCLNNCLFCNENPIWGCFRTKKPTTIKKEIEYYNKNYGISKFELVDNAFNLSEGFKKALNQLYDLKIEIRWGGNCELSRINEKQIRDYIKLGLTHCYFGLESASQKLLKLMRKKIDLNKVTRILKVLSYEGIRAYFYIMIGFPNEKQQDFEKTIEFLNKHSTYIKNIVVSVFSLMKNSPIFKSDLVKPIALGPQELNAWTYKTFDGVSHRDRMNRFLFIKNFWKKINN